MALKVGDKAPDFTLKNQDVEDVRLSSWFGEKNVLLLFFPLANSSVCEKELCTIGDGFSHYTNLNAQVVAVSVDSVHALRLFKEKNNFQFPLLSDFNKEVCNMYEAVHEIFAPGKLDYKGVAKRSAFVIDKSGIIRYAEVLESPGDEPSYEAIKAVLEELQ